MSQPPIKKRWGQNFINNKNIIDKIISVFNPNKDDVILEIGPGRGALTFPLSKISKNLIAVEIDPKLTEKLNQTISSNTQIVYIPMAQLGED